MLWVSIKIYSTMSTWREVWSFLLIHCKMAVLPICSKIYQKYLWLGGYFLAPQTSGICFINVRICQRKRSSYKFRLQKRLFYDKGLAKNLPSYFLYFWYCSNFKINFDKNLMKKATYHFLTTKFLLCCKILR